MAPKVFTWTINVQGDFELEIDRHKIIVPKNVPDDFNMRIRTNESIEYRLGRILDKDSGQTTWDFEQVSMYVPNIHSDKERLRRDYPDGIDGV